MLFIYRLPMGNLHVLNTINLHQQLRIMVIIQNIYRFYLCILIFILTIGRRNGIRKYDNN